MRPRGDGERILMDGRLATVHLRPASASGLQMITFDHVEHWLFRALWLPWQRLVAAPDAPANSASGPGAEGEASDGHI